MIRGNEYKKLDWPLITCYLILVIIGWTSIFSSVYDKDHGQIFDISQRYVMQFIWIVSSVVIALLVLFIINPKIYSTLSWIIYGCTILLLLAVGFLGVEVNGSKSWFEFGPIRFQPAEFSKIATTMVLASLMNDHNFRLKSLAGIVKVALIILVPMGIMIIMQKETGSALVYTAFIFMLYREGMSGWYIVFGILAIALFLVTLGLSPFVALIVLTITAIIVRGFLSGAALKHLLLSAVILPLMIFSPKLGDLPSFSGLHLAKELWLSIVIIPLLVTHIVKDIKATKEKYWGITLLFITSVLFIFSVEFFFEKVLQDHQKVRIENLLGINVDLKGAGYNVHQSKIAIGSGGFMGKGFLNGTQTKYNFVPEQSTDFIFCTVGEEWGFIGSSMLILLYLYLIIRILNLADKQRDSFNRIFGYSLASILFLHFFINIGMTMGLIPVIGIPLPFISYGGSSLLSFTIFLFIFIKLDLDRWK